MGCRDVGLGMSALAKRAKMGRWSSVPWFSAFPAVVAVTKAREGGTHSTQAALSSSAPGTTRSALWTTGPWAITSHGLCASAREESNTGWWSSAPWFSAFSAVATVPKAREGGAHSTQASPSSSVSAQPRSVRLRVILRVVRFPLRVGVRRRVPTPVVLM